jgi:hypothetical protein
MTLHVFWRASHAAAAKAEPIIEWSLKLIKIGAKVVSDGRCVIFQMAEVWPFLGKCSRRFCG